MNSMSFKNGVLRLFLAYITAFTLMACQSKQWDTAPLRIEKTVPAVNATGVSVNTPITITFNKKVHPVSFKMTVTGGGQTVNGATSIDEAVVTFTPAAALLANTDYTVVVAGTVEDSAKNPMEAEYRWTFRTGSAGTGGGGTPLWHTFIGNAFHTVAYSVATTADGGVIVSGYANMNIPNIDGLAPRNPFTGVDMLVVKLTSAGAVAWYTFLGTSGPWEVGYSVQETSDGGYIVAGYSGGNIGTLQGKTPINPYNNSNDYLVIKLTSSGDVSWYTFLSGNGNDGIQSISGTSDGGCILTGLVTENVPTLSGLSPLIPYVAGEEAMVVKLTSAGAVSWYTFLGGSGYDRGQSIQQTADGGYIMAGSAAANIPTLGGRTPVNSYGGGTDAFIVKLDSAGAVVWYTLLGGSISEYVYSIRETADGGYIAAGYGTTNIPSLSGLSPVYPLVGAGSDALVFKLNSSGTLSWFTFLGGTNQEIARSIQQTSDGGYIVAGLSNGGTVTLGGMAPLKAYAQGGNYTTMMVKLTSTGTASWYTFIGDGADFQWSNVRQGADGGFFVAGSSSVSFTVPSGTAPVRPYTSGTELFVLRMRADGSF